MTTEEKKDQLRRQITLRLANKIDRDFILMDLPYHTNIGDTLIWAGTKQFYESLGRKCLYQSSIFTFDNRNISQETPIVFLGGGNFGDVWRCDSDFRNMIISKYPNNKILILPQTVFYESEELLSKDARLFAKCKDLTICARDKRSYELLCSKFDNEVLLVPDMAFFMNLSSKKSNSGKTLFFKRKDREFAESEMFEIVPKDSDIREWPTIETYYRPYRILETMYRFPAWIRSKVVDEMWRRYLFDFNIKKGVEFIDGYDTVYTTRLHGAILSILLGKEVFLFDNSYGKNRGFYETWLEDLDTIHMIG